MRGDQEYRLCILILLPAGTHIVFPVGTTDGGYVAGRGGGYSDNLLRRLSG